MIKIKEQQEGERELSCPNMNPNYFHLLYCQHPGYETVICWIPELPVKSLRIVGARPLVH